MGLIQMTITLLISTEKIQDLCSNSSSEFVLSKTFWPRLKFLTIQKLLSKWLMKVTFQHLLKTITARE